LGKSYSLDQPKSGALDLNLKCGLHVAVVSKSFDGLLTCCFYDEVLEYDVQLFMGCPIRKLVWQLFENSYPQIVPILLNSKLYCQLVAAMSKMVQEAS
jgi:hypothetical protein